MHVGSARDRSSPVKSQYNYTVLKHSVFVRYEHDRTAGSLGPFALPSQLMGADNPTTDPA